MKDAFQVAFAVLASLGGGAAIVLAFSSWLGRVWATRILAGEKHRFEKELEALRAELQSQRELLKAELNKAVHVHRVQFAVELRALRAVWFRLAILRSCFGSLYPGFELVPAGADLEARRKRKVEAFMRALNRYFWAIHKYSPFYPKGIYDELIRCLETSQAEEVNSRTYQDSMRRESKAEGRENLTEFMASVDRASDAIRERLRVLSST